MYRLKEHPVGIYEKAIPDARSWPEKIAIAKRAGFDFIEMSIDESDQRLARLYWTKTERRALRELLEEQEFAIPSICLSGHRRYPFGSKDSKTRQMAYQIIDRAIGLAKDLGVANIQLAGYDVYYEPADEETKSLFIEGLRYATKRASAAEVMLSIEIMDTEFIGTISRCLEYIEVIRSPWLQIYLDIGNLSQWTNKPINEIEKGMSHLVGIHLKDTRPGQFKCVPFGEGTVDFDGLLPAIKRLNYQGPFLIEMWADNGVEETNQQTIARISQAKAWLSAKAEGMF